MAKSRVQSTRNPPDSKRPKKSRTSARAKTSTRKTTKKTTTRKKTTRKKAVRKKPQGPDPRVTSWVKLETYLKHHWPNDAPARKNLTESIKRAQGKSQWPENWPEAPSIDEPLHAPHVWRWYQERVQKTVLPNEPYPDNPKPHEDCPTPPEISRHLEDMEWPDDPDGFNYGPFQNPVQHEIPRAIIRGGVCPKHLWLKSQHDIKEFKEILYKHGMEQKLWIANARETGALIPREERDRAQATLARDLKKAVEQLAPIFAEISGDAHLDCLRDHQGDLEPELRRDINKLQASLAVQFRDNIIKLFNQIGGLNEND